MKKYLIPTTFMLLTTSPLLANTEGYIGLNLSYDRAFLYDEYGEYITNVSGYGIDSNDVINPNNFGFSFNAGIQMNKYLGIEGFFQYTLPSRSDLSMRYATLTTKVQSLSFGADILGYIPVSEGNFSFIGSLGIGYYWFNTLVEVLDYYSLRYADTSKDSYLGFRFGLGGQYAFTENISWRTMVRYINIDSDKYIDAIDGALDISTGIKYTF